VDLHQLAVCACSRWWQDRDHDDLLQEAWIAGAQNTRPMSDAAMVWLMRCRAIDFLRRRDTRRNDTGFRFARPITGS
jgi:DNA-directed RNA polymerase specialized sigma24 family protein